MADKSIGELPVSPGMTDDALLVVYQNGETESIEGSLIKQYARESTKQYVEGAKQSAEAAAGSAAAAQKSREGVEEHEAKAKASADAAASSAGAAQASAGVADAAKADVAANAAKAKTSADNAKTSETASKASETAAGKSATDADAAKKAAQAAQTAAEAAKASSETSATNAHNSATAASGSATSAGNSATAAAGAATAASQAQVGAESARDTAITAKNDAVTAKTSSEAAKTAAEAARAAAKASETNSKASETAAAGSKSAADAAAQTATEQAGIATTKAGEAATSAGAAKTSETNSKASETAAKGSEAAAAGSAGTAKSEADRAKSEADRAATIVGGDFPTKAEARGYVSAHDVNASSHADIRSALSAAQQLAQEAKSLAEGRSRAVSYAGYSTMVAAVNIMSKTAMRVGDNLLLEALGVPDLWVSKVEATAVIYTYTTDEALVTALMSGPVQMGYYKLTMLETPKVDLSGYVPIARTINGKPLIGNITLTAADIGLGKSLTFTGAVSGTYNGTADETINIPEAGGKRTCRFVVGTSTAGWTAKDCDYLCDGTDDQVEINAAIQALPATGGEVVILDGTYNITAAIAVNKTNTKLTGSGAATVLKRMWKSSVKEGVIQVVANNCIVTDLMVDGSRESYTTEYQIGIYVTSSNNTITRNTCNRSYGSGISLSGASSNIVSGNICFNNNNYCINLLTSTGNTITENKCSSSNNGIDLRTSSSTNVISGNICSGCSNGIYLDGVSNNTVVGNTCSGNNDVGIVIRAASSTSNTATGNVCNNNYDGISLTSCVSSIVAENICNNNQNRGIILISASNCILTGNICNNNNYGIYLLSGNNNNNITGNTAMRGTGLSSDYAAGQYTIQLKGTTNNYNLIADNGIMGKNYVAEGGTGNTFVNNKYN